MHGIRRTSETATRRAAAAVARIAKSAESLDVVLDRLYDPESKARVLAAAEGASHALNAVLDRLRGRLADQLPYTRPVTYRGLKPLKRHVTGGSAHWDGPLAASKVAAQVADEIMWDPKTGERYDELPPVPVICQRVADALVDCIGLTPSKAWRSTSLRHRGIDPGPLVEYTEGRRTVRWV